MSRGGFKTFAESMAILAGGPARKARQVEPEAPLYIPDSDPEAQIYYVLTEKGLAEFRELELDARFGPLTKEG